VYWTDGYGDARIEVPRVRYEPADDRLGKTSAAIRARVEAARERQRRTVACVVGAESIRPAHLAGAIPYLSGQMLQGVDLTNLLCEPIRP
jgi:hypothetical protein